MSVLDTTCSAEGCSARSADFLTSRCAFHNALAAARNLAPEQFDLLRTTLETTPPISDEERRTRRVKFELGRIEWTARDLKRHKRDARSHGATDDQIKAAIRRGRAAS